MMTSTELADLNGGMLPEKVVLRHRVTGMRIRVIQGGRSFALRGEVWGYCHVLRQDGHRDMRWREWTGHLGPDWSVEEREPLEGVTGRGA